MKAEGAPQKTRRLLQIIFLGFALILFRVWHLEVIQKDTKKAEAELPQRRVLVQKAHRGTIVDRFNIPLATNKICYSATLYYNQIAQIPATSWQEKEGQQISFSPRRDYISALSAMLASALQLDPSRVEDLIYSKASLFPNAPFQLKAHLTEAEYYQLASLEKDWPGLHAEISSERFYPEGKCGSEILGSMGSISSKQYLQIADEIRMLQALINDVDQGNSYALPEGYAGFNAVTARLQELKEKSYRMQDLVGKSGIEGFCEEKLRGFYGEKAYSVDQKGKILHELPGSKEAIAGQHIQLTLSIELQQLAEELLIENEAWREQLNLRLHPEIKQPWVKGGAIVAIDPNTGEVLAMASTPRFDPNDFIPTGNPIEDAQKQKHLSRWLENERQIADLWDGKQELTRERTTKAKTLTEESVTLTWDRFLDCLLPLNSPLRNFFQRVDDVKTAVQVQEEFDSLLYHASLSHPKRSPLDVLNTVYPTKECETISLPSEAIAVMKRLDPFFAPLATNQDRLFAIDLCRLVVYAPAFTDEVLKSVGAMKLSDYRALNQEMCRLETKLKDEERKAYRKTEFALWRKQHQKEFLAEKRLQEKKTKRTARPYLDYLDRKEKELFEGFWKEKRIGALKSSLSPASPGFAAIETFRSFEDLERPLLTTYRHVRSHTGGQIEKHLASAFYPIGGFGHSRSYAFQANAPQGSVFKLVSGYAGLLQTDGDNFLSIIDEVKPRPPSFSVASSLSGAPYLRMYKGGRLPKSSRYNIGKIDLIGAIEQSSNPYFAIMAGDVLKNPEDLNDAARLFGFGSPTGIGLRGETGGNLPNDLRQNRTGLYSTAMGQHTLLSTPLQTATMLSAIANGGKVLKPELLKECMGSSPNRDSFAECKIPELPALGLSFNLFTALSSLKSEQSQPLQPKIVRTLKFPGTSREQLLEGMRRVLWGAQGNSRPEIIRLLRANPHLQAPFLALRNQMIGKTGTAEVLFNSSLNPSSAGQMIKHIWFGAISFESETDRSHPELVVIVYLRHGVSGREAAPLAAQIIDKWRALKKRYN